MQSVPPCSAPAHWRLMQVSRLLLHWQSHIGTYSVVFLFFSQLYCPLRFQNSPQTHLWEHFLLCGNFSSFMSPSPGQVSIPSLFLCFFVFYICPTSFWREWAPFLGIWCPLPAFRSCFVEVAQHSNELLMNVFGRKWSLCPIPPPSWDHLLKCIFNLQFSNLQWVYQDEPTVSQEGSVYDFNLK